MTVSVQRRVVGMAEKLRNALLGMLPLHTQAAIDALASDLRSDSPKDLDFLKKHALALKPRSIEGWLFVFTLFMGVVAAEFALLFVGVIVVSTITIASCFAMAIIGAVLNIFLIPFGLVLFASACFWGVLAFSVGSGACAFAIGMGILKYVKALLLGPSQSAKPTTHKTSHLPLPFPEDSKGASNAE